MRTLLIGLDCLGPDVLPDGHLAEAMPRVNAIARKGQHGVLQSILPPITIPAWTAMLSGRDPGELGLYGFRNRMGYGYDALRYADARHVKVPRIWDRLARDGRPSVLVGVPQTSPVPSDFLGALVCGFEGPLDETGVFTAPPALMDEVRAAIGDYIFDIEGFRGAAPAVAVETARVMTEKRFAVMRRLITTRSWDFAMIHEIGPDRMHHLFWRHHDPRHPGYRPGSPLESAIVDYYRLLDREVGALIDAAGEDTAMIIASDHGATAMHGAVAVNEVLIQAGLLTLKETPATAVPFRSDLVDWSRTACWAEGGYYARIFLNIAGREPQGLVPAEAADALIDRLRGLFADLDLGDGRRLRNQLVEPRDIYRRVRGIAPDAMVFFENESWRSVSLVGTGRRWLEDNDTGADNANHARDGMYALLAPGAPARGRQDASLLDIAPTLEHLLDLPADATLSGRDLLAEAALPAVPA